MTPLQFESKWGGRPIPLNVGNAYLMREFRSDLQLVIAEAQRDALEKAVEFINAAEELGLATITSTDGTPCVLFHPPSDLPRYKDGYRPSRVWHGSKEGYVDTQVTFDAIDKFNERLEAIRALLPSEVKPPCPECQGTVRKG